MNLDFVNVVIVRIWKTNIILLCLRFSALRVKYIPRYYRVRPNMYKFVQLMSSENINLLRKLAAYVFHAFKLRNEILY